MKLSTDTAAFLETLLFVADSPDHEKRPFEDSTIYDFHPEFVAAVDSFIERFREYLSTNHPDMDPDAGERSFGGNVFSPSPAMGADSGMLGTWNGENRCTRHLSRFPSASPGADATVSRNWKTPFQNTGAGKSTFLFW